MDKHRRLHDPIASWPISTSERLGYQFKIHAFVYLLRNEMRNQLIFNLGAAVAGALIVYVLPAQALASDVGRGFMAFFVGTFAIFIAVYIRYPHRFAASLTAPVTLKGRFRATKVLHRAQKQLLTDFKQLDQGLMLLADENPVRERSYRDQMVLAKYFYLSHRQRFWATSLDPIRQFYEGNQDYLAAMPVPVTGKTSAGEISRIPVRARLFIQSWTHLIYDLAYHDFSVVRLVDQHLKAWGSGRGGSISPPIRVLPIAEVSAPDGGCPISEKLRNAMGIGRNDVNHALIPDFMVVDDLFVYGRVDPKIVPPFPPEGRDVVLQLLTGRETVGRYREAFESLWERALEFEDLARALVTLQQSESRILAEYSAALPQVCSPGESEPLPPKEVKEMDAKCRATVERVSGRISQAFAIAERENMYDKHVLSLTGDRLVEAFADTYIRPAQGRIIAIDLADMKYQERFWITWLKRSNFMRFDEASRQTNASDLRRIFVLADRAELDSTAAHDFLYERVSEENHSRVGIITQADLGTIDMDQFEKHLGSEVRDDAKTKARFDSDFIIVDVPPPGRSPGENITSRGFEVSYELFSQNGMDDSSVRTADPEPLLSFTPESNLLLSDRIVLLTSWFEFLWAHPDTFLIENPSGLKHLNAWVTKGRATDD